MFNCLQFKVVDLSRDLCAREFSSLAARLCRRQRQSYRVMKIQIIK